MFYIKFGRFLFFFSFFFRGFEIKVEVYVVKVLLSRRKCLNLAWNLEDGVRFYIFALYLTGGSGGGGGGGGGGGSGGGVSNS